MADPLRARLFGYGVPYRARPTDEGLLLPLETSPEREAGITTLFKIYNT